MRIKRIHHLTVAVRDLDGARLTFEQIFGGRGERAVEAPAFGVRVVDLPLGDSTLQLASPTAADNPVMRFLERRGEGFYNLALEIEDLDAAVRELASQGVRVSEPVAVEPGMRAAFVTMAATHGLSIQLIEIASAGAESFSESVEPPSDESAAPAKGSPDDQAEPPQPLDLTPDEWSDVD